MTNTKVVILNWNGEQHLQRFLPSVVENTPKEIGIVVADNGSEDNSLALLKEKFPTVEVIELGKNYGFAEGYNIVLNRIEARRVVLLNSDVETQKGWIEPLVEMMNSDRKIFSVMPKILSYTDKDSFEYAGASGGFIDILGYPFCRGRILSTIEVDNDQYNDVREIFWSSGACMIVDVEAFKRVGGFDSRFFAHFEEIDLCWRAQKMGYKVIVEPKSKVYHLGGGTLPNNNPRKIYLNYRNSLATLYKNLPSNRLFITVLSRLLLDGASASVYLFTGRFSFVKAVFNAHKEFFHWHRYLKTERKKIEEQSTTEPTTIYKGSIIARYLFGYMLFSDI